MNSERRRLYRDAIQTIESLEEKEEDFAKQELLQKLKVNIKRLQGGEETGMAPV